ncbi:transketolase, partial [Klebsiella pneumoniae]
RGEAARADWHKRFDAAAAGPRAEFQRRVIDRKRPAALDAAVAKLKAKLVAEAPTVATRKASEMALEVLVAEVPELLLGSADLTPSNNTRTKDLKEIGPGRFDGRY